MFAAQPALATPIVKWAGGKRWLAPRLGPSLWDALVATNGRYIEPFLGAGAMALWLGWPRATLADMCPEIVAVHRAVRDDPEDLDRELRVLIARGTDCATYNRLRVDRPPAYSNAPDSDVELAAWTIYMLCLNYNGLWRVNRRGEYNVPYGERKSPRFPLYDAYTLSGRALTGAAIDTASFERTIATASSGDVVYADPPYHAAFAAYTHRGFTSTDHAALATALRSASRRGATVVLSNADTPYIRKLYGWAYRGVVYERRAINRDGTGRAPVGCLLASNDPTIVDSMLELERGTVDAIRA